MFPSYRNQSVDLESKSNDWFLYDGTLAVKELNRLYRCLLRLFFQIIRDVDHPCINGDP